MKILYLYDGHWPHNATRVSKQVDSLIAAGHTVRLLSRGSANAPSFEDDGRISVARIPQLRNRVANRLVNYPVFLNPVWLHHIRKNVRQGKVDCIVVRDLPLAPAALLIGAMHGLPVHYDMAEVYPLGLRSMLSHETGLPLRIVRSLRAAEAVERYVIHRATTTFVVSEESRNRCISLGVPEERVVLVGNTPANPDELSSEWAPPQDIADVVGRPIALFVGNLFADRGLRYAIDAMAIVARELPAAMLVIIGDGRERARLEEQVDALGLRKNVRLLGWKHHREHPAYLRHAQVGILPFLATEHICITLANKLFDYMGAGLPVVASDVPPMRRILEESNAGLLVPAADAKSLAGALTRLFNDRALREEMGSNGMRAVAGPYAWRNDAQRFVAAIERAAGVPRERTTEKALAGTAPL
jgi:glycosyltransferase involved in cell wall biosynthesis